MRQDCILEATAIILLQNETQRGSMFVVDELILYVQTGYIFNSHFYRLSDPTDEN